MNSLYLYNTLSRKKEEFRPINQNEIGLYTCGPTVYNFAHLGNLRTYLFEDFLKRVLEYDGYRVKHVMNITDVGHLAGDRDMGEDKLELGAKREGKTAYEIAALYEKAFRLDLAKLNIIEPRIYCRATENIPEQIRLIEILEQKGFAYRISDGLYYDTSRFPEYTKLSHLDLDELKEGARVEKNKEKRNPTDFALWKFSPTDSKRQMEWESPWGVGFPGWHIECSAMSLKYLGEALDIHCGGLDHINVHHTNEIAQSEAATGKKFFNYWIHGAFLNIAGGKKMAKSEGDFLTLEKAVESIGLDPLSYRFAALQVHYRKPMDYSPEALKQAQAGLDNLRSLVASLGEEQGELAQDYKDRFIEAVSDDLNLPQGLAVAFELLKSDKTNADKRRTILDFDEVLGLRLEDAKSAEINLDEADGSVRKMIEERENARKNKDWKEADRLRQAVRDAGYEIEDTADGCRLLKI